MNSLRTIKVPQQVWCVIRLRDMAAIYATSNTLYTAARGVISWLVRVPSLM